MCDEERKFRQLKRWAKRFDLELGRYRGLFLLVDAKTNNLVREFQNLDGVCEWFQDIRWSPIEC